MDSINNHPASSQEAKNKQSRKRNHRKDKKQKSVGVTVRVNVVYLLHFSRPYHHAKHYIGTAKDLDQRLNEHTNKQGARLTQVVIEAGITFECVRTWRGGRREERRLKKFKKATALCPYCKQEVNAKRRAKYHAKRKENSN